MDMDMDTRRNRRHCDAGAIRCVCVQRGAKKLACLMTCISGCMYVQARGWVHTCLHESPLHRCTRVVVFCVHQNSPYEEGRFFLHPCNTIGAIKKSNDCKTDLTVSQILSSCGFTARLGSFHAMQKTGGSRDGVSCTHKTRPEVFCNARSVFCNARSFSKIRSENAIFVTEAIDRMDDPDSIPKARYLYFFFDPHHVTAVELWQAAHGSSSTLKAHESNECAAHSQRM